MKADEVVSRHTRCRVLACTFEATKPGGWCWTHAQQAQIAPLDRDEYDLLRLLLVRASDTTRACGGVSSPAFERLREKVGHARTAGGDS